MASPSVQPFASFSVYEGLLLHVKLGTGVPAYEEFKAFLERLRVFLRRKQSFTLFIDASQMGAVPVAYVLKVAAFLKKERPSFKQYLGASAVYVRSELVRKLLNSVFALQPPACPNLIVNSEEEGMAFIEQFMTPAG